MFYVVRFRTRCKLLFHDGSGFVLIYKRLDRGHFARMVPTRPACYRAFQLRLRGRFSHHLVEGNGVGTPAMALGRLLASLPPGAM